MLYGWRPFDRLRAGSERSRRINAFFERYATTSMKGRNKYGLGGFPYLLIRFVLDEFADFWVDLVLSYLVR